MALRLEPDFKCQLRDRHIRRREEPTGHLNPQILQPLERRAARSRLETAQEMIGAEARHRGDLGQRWIFRNFGLQEFLCAAKVGRRELLLGR